MGRRTLALAATATLALSLVAALPAGAQADEPQTVSITLSLGNWGDETNKIFEVVDVPVGDGPELTGSESEVVFNEGEWSGAFSVDVDNVAKTVTVATVDDSQHWRTLAVVIEGEGIDTLDVVSDNLWSDVFSDSIDPFDDHWAMNLAIQASPGIAVAAWESNRPGYGAIPNPPGTGIAVFSFGEPAPPPPTPGEDTAPADVVRAAPRFTG